MPWLTNRGEDNREAELTQSMLTVSCEAFVPFLQSQVQSGVRR